MPVCDVAVIGAGIVGAAATFRLAEQGLRVCVLEAAKAPATGATARSAAGVRVQFTEAVNVLLSKESIWEYRHFPEILDADSGYKPIGYLFLVPEDEAQAYRQALRLQAELGVRSQELDNNQARELVDFAEEGIAFATWGPDDGVIDPHAVTMAYLRAAREIGAELLLETELLEARAVSGGWRMTTGRSELEAGAVVNAAGAWAGEVARRAGFELPVEPYRRMVFMTGPLPEAEGLPLVVDVASGFYLRGEQQRVLFGRSNPNEPPGFREGMDWGWLEPTLEAGMGRFPWLERAGLDQRASWWGYYAITPDHNPILGRMPGLAGWYNAVGFSGHGVQHAAAVGRVIAEEITEGRARTVNIDPLRYERFAAGAALSERNIV
ncbi:NAD(P)/FAD-dependent oxidoreductase [Oceanithermus sp.]